MSLALLRRITDKKEDRLGNLLKSYKGESYHICSRIVFFLWEIIFPVLCYY